MSTWTVTLDDFEGDLASRQDTLITADSCEIGAGGVLILKRGLEVYAAFYEWVKVVRNH